MTRFHGITTVEYQQLFEEQGGVCAICHGPETRRSKDGHAIRLSIDHDHDSLEIRGLLCHRCNHLLGWIDPDRLYVVENAIAYLTKERHHGLYDLGVIEHRRLNAPTETKPSDPNGGQLILLERRATYDVTT